MSSTAMAMATTTPVRDDAAWTAVLNHDRTQDGNFVYAVRTTGVYCRPSCPSRRPRRANVRFLPHADPRQNTRAFVHAGGVGPMRRRVPRLSGVWLPREHTSTNTTTDTSRCCGSHVKSDSVRHICNAHLRVLVGLSPKAYEDALRRDRIKARLRTGESVTRATYAAGFGSMSTIYRRQASALGITPGSTVAAERAPPSHTASLIRRSAACSWHARSAESAQSRSASAMLRWNVRSRTSSRRPPACAMTVPSRRGRARSWMWWTGAATEARCRSTCGGPRSRCASGVRCSRSRPARRVPTARSPQPRRTSAARAVARACATNHVAVIVPCHRVIASSGKPAGYRWGVDRKRRLLERERATNR